MRRILKRQKIHRKQFVSRPKGNCIQVANSCFQGNMAVHEFSVNMNLHTSLRLEWCPLADFENEMKATFKGKRGKKEGTISPTLYSFAQKK